jgi:hypothetical protein
VRAINTLCLHISACLKNQSTAKESHRERCKKKRDRVCLLFWHSEQLPSGLASVGCTVQHDFFEQVFRTIFGRREETWSNINPSYLDSAFVCK